MKLLDTHCKHGLLYCPSCLGARNPAARALVDKRSVKMGDRRKKRQKDKDRKELKAEIASAERKKK